MKDILKGIGMMLLLAFIFFPWAAGIVDLIWIFLTDSQLTNIIWNWWRVAFGFLWPIALVFILGNVFL